MILSLLDLELSAPSVRQSFQNCQDLHRNIMKAFDLSRSEAKVLYRVERTSKEIRIYVQSDAEPHWDRIDSNGFHCLKTKDISLLPASFHGNQILRFTLLGCPSKKVEGEGKNSKRVILRGDEAQLEWLKRQGEKNGFTILEAHVKGTGERLTGKKASGAFYLTGVLFEGVLQIQDPDAFRKGFEEGIGPEKAYGFGMMMVTKVV